MIYCWTVLEAVATCWSNLNYMLKSRQIIIFLAVYTRKWKVPTASMSNQSHNPHFRSKNHHRGLMKRNGGRAYGAMNKK
jgi:hypothetical protein